jgi:RNA polymerase sigma factor (sigma-70 family)
VERELIDEYTPFVESIVYKHVQMWRAWDIQDDLLQAAMEGLCSAAARYMRKPEEKRTNFRSYMTQSVYGQIFDERRRSLGGQRRGDGSKDLVILEMISLDDLNGHTPATEDVNMDVVGLRIVVDKCGILSDEEWLVIKYSMSCKTDQEIANLMATTKAEVKEYYSSAVKKLRSYMQG